MSNFLMNLMLNLTESFVKLDTITQDFILDEIKQNKGLVEFFEYVRNEDKSLVLRTVKMMKDLKVNTSGWSFKGSNIVASVDGILPILEYLRELKDR